jgi:hypothetical protein
MTMENIPIGKTGQILSGEYKDWYIRVEPEVKGGHLILYMSTPDPKSKGYDHWVETEKLGKYFEEIALEIKWPD